MRIHSLLSTLSFAMLALVVDARAAEPHPQIPLWDKAAIEALCDPTIDRWRHMQATMEAKKDSAGILAEWNGLAIAISDLDGPLSLIANVAVDQGTRDAADACELKITPFTTSLFQSEALYRRVRDLKPGDAIDRQYRQDLLENFEDAGVTLAPEKRERVKAIRQEIADLGQQFEKNLRDDRTNVVVSPAELAGLPDGYVKAQPKDADGNTLLSMANPVYIPFMQLASNADARKRYWIARQNYGGQANIDLLNRAVALRLELAKLYGEPDYATFVIKRRMARTPAAVYRFLDDVHRAAAPLEKAEVAELTQFKADDQKLPVAEVKLDRWDTSYYQEKLRKARYDVDQEALRKYFPTEASIAYTLRIAETLYGIRFVPSQAPTWHPDVRVFDVVERGKDGAKDGAADGKFIGTVYLDLFPRPGKYNHAAAWPVRPVSTLAKQKAAPGYRTPLSALVTNFDRVGLNQDELETMLHEFGHVMHGVLSRTRYADQAGTSVKQDFVEAPSQMFEEWARREDALKFFAEVCKDCPHLSHEQIERLQQAHRYGRGSRYARQWVYASYDMALTTPQPDEAMDAWRKIEGDTPLGTYPGTRFPASFGHLMTGYAAGYYGYLWSEVLALDMLSGFHGKLMNPVDGQRYRADILSQGGQEPPERLVERFLGRAPNSEAFFQEINGQR